MAQIGFYRDPPSRRMAYDSDGTTCVRLLNGVITERDETFTVPLNGEAYVQTYYNGGFEPYGYNVLIFPELRDVSHSYRNMFPFIYSPGSHTADWEVSSNTTNGLDGDWTVSNTFTALEEPTVPNFRENMEIVGATNVKGIRWLENINHAFTRPSMAQWHVYGYKSAGQTPHRIEFCDVEGNDLMADFDFGDQPRNSERIWRPSETWNQGTALYIKNKSSSKQANDINISFEVVNDSSDFNDGLLLSKDNISYTSAINFTQLDPLEMEGPIYVKYNATIDADFSLKAGRLKVTTDTWL